MARLLPLNLVTVVFAAVFATNRPFASTGKVVAADAVVDIRAVLEKLDPAVLAPEFQDSQRTMMGRVLRTQIADANAASTAEWNGIHSRRDWEAFRTAKLKLLARSLSRQAFAPGMPKVTMTGMIPGDGLRIENLVIQPAGRTVITANLYVPDPMRDSMPGILLSHSHHNPKHEGELQDMGMTWARAGCCVLVPDHLGHGERRQHPFHSAADYPRSFAVGRQDYYFRYDMSLQLSLVGESLMGWMVHDLMSCIDVLCARPGVDSKRILLLGSVAGGGDPAAVTAALDARIACVAPFNFGGPQPESPYPLPPDAETRFNYVGSGSWESTRNLARSAAEGFLPWVIVGSVAPRHLIHAHEFAWDRERDPVWKRYQKIWGFYEQGERLAFAHGHGTLTSKVPPGSHCNNIGAVHRQQIHEAFRKWFGIDVKPADEFSARRSSQELACLTEQARQQLEPRTLQEILSAMADQQLAASRAARSTVTPQERRKFIRESWTRLLGDVQPRQELIVREGSPHIEEVDGMTVTRISIEPEPEIRVPIMMLTKHRGSPVDKPSRVMVHVASDGIEGILRRRRDALAKAVESESVVVLTDVRGTGESSAGSDRGPQGSAAAHSATHCMLGQTVLAGQLRDLRAVWKHVRTCYPNLDTSALMIVGDSDFVPLAADAAFSYPRRIDRRPPECDPTGALLASLLGLFEDDVHVVRCHRGLVSYRSAMESPFVQIPHSCIVPGLFQEADLPDLISGQVPVAAQRQVQLGTLIDGLGRRVSIVAAKSAYQLAEKAFAQANGSQSHLVGSLYLSDDEFADP